MTTPQRISVFLAAGALALAAASVGRHSRSPMGSSAGAVEEMAAELSALRDRVAQLEKNQRIDGLRAGSFLANAKDPAPSAAPQSAPGSEEPKPEKKRVTVVTALDERLENEEIDSAWSGPTLGRLRTAIQNTLPRYEVVDAGCASTLCRVVLRAGQGADPNELGAKLPNVAPFDQGTAMYTDTSGEVPVTTIFVTRDGRAPWEVAAL